MLERSSARMRAIHLYLESVKEIAGEDNTKRIPKTFGGLGRRVHAAWPSGLAPLPLGKAPESRVVSVAATGHSQRMNYNPGVVSRAFKRDEGADRPNTANDAWASLFSPEDVVGIKINCIGAPRISSSLASINAALAGLKSAG
jgi:hypothetical protein